MEHVPHAGLLEFLLVVVGNDAADHHGDVLELRLLQRLHQLRHQQMVRGERGNADHVHVLLLGEADHLGDLLPRRGVEHIHAGIAQEGCHHPAAAIVAVEADLGDEYLGRVRRPNSWSSATPAAYFDWAAPCRNVFTNWRASAAVSARPAPRLCQVCV